MTDSLVKYATTFESTNNLPMSIEIGHGENADLVASFKDGGIDVGLSGYTARAIYQPKSKWGTDEWYECPCEIVNDTVIAHWGNTYDNGDNAVKLFMHLVKDGKLAYPAIYQISLFSTPGFSPSAIEPIPETIDFSQYTLLNAPWVPLAGDVSVTGDLTMDDKDIIHSETRTATFKNILYSNDMENYYSGDVTVSFDSRFIEDLTHICDEKIPITITGVLKSSGETEVTKAFLTSPFKNPYFPDRIQWQIVDESEVNIGTLSFSSHNGNIVANSGTIHGDFMMDGEFQADSTSEITDSRKYIYDDMGLASKTEVRHLESKVGSLENEVKDIAQSGLPFTKKIVTLSETGSTIYPLNHEVFGVHYGNNLTQFTISLPVPMEGVVTEFYVDVNNLSLASPISVSLTSPSWQRGGYSISWTTLKDEDGAVFGECAMGAVTRMHFRELGTHDTIPQMLVESQTLVPMT